MTPRQFESQYKALWAELERGLGAFDAGRVGKKPKTGAGLLDAAPAIGGARVAQLYRQCCEHLALARERAYPVHLVTRLETLTARAHQRIYRRHDYGLAALRDLVLYTVPTAVRALRWHLLISALVFILPILVLGIATWIDPHFVLTVVDPDDLRNFESWYGPDANERLGRSSGDDWQMFGFYILHNIGLAFQCYASGLILGVGSLFMVLFNGVMFGAVAGFLVDRGDALRFFSFVVTHSAFELTAIVLAGAAGLRLGHALLAPGRLTRTQALIRSARETTPVMVCAFVMLVTAAALEAFWSPAAWVPAVIKFAVGACCWLAVFAYLGLQGRGAAIADLPDAVAAGEAPAR